MSGYYELTTINFNDTHHYYYFYSPRAIRNPKSALNYGCAPDAVRLLIQDKEETPVHVAFISPFNYFYRKYFKKRRSFIFGYRCDWEKEIKEYLKRA